MSFPAVGYSTGRTPPNFVKLDSIGSIVNTIKKKKIKIKKTMIVKSFISSTFVFLIL